MLSKQLKQKNPQMFFFSLILKWAIIVTYVILWVKIDCINWEKYI